MSTALESKLLKAKIEVMTKSVFISTICTSVRHIITDAVETAATYDLIIEYNPQFIEPLSVPQLAGLIAHECWHIAFQHILRRGMRERDRWNFAGDFVINNMLLAAGFELPPGGLWDKQYTGMTTDAVYDALPPEPPGDGGQLMMDIMGDPAADQKQAAANQSAVTNVLVRAQTTAKLAGTAAGEIPGEILRVIDELLNPVLPWETLMLRFMDQRARDEYNWAHRSRRFRHVYMPARHSIALGHLTWAIDTSGSQTDDELTGVLSEIKGVQEVFNPAKMTIIDCDKVIHNVYEIDQNTDIMDLKFTGGGGTSFMPVLDYVQKHPTQALVYFSDLYGNLKMQPPSYPVLWICNSNHSPAPFGETIYLDSKRN